MEIRAAAPDLTFFLAAERDEPHDPADLQVDTLIYLSRSPAERQIYPAIDAVRSRSSPQTVARAGRRHCATAEAVRGALERLGTEHRLGSEGKQDDDLVATSLEAATLPVAAAIRRTTVHEIGGHMGTAARNARRVSRDT